MSDLFQRSENSFESNYSAKDIEVLEGLEPVRRRPGMYIGGTDERSMHHLVAEVLDNSMDEAVAGYANRIEIQLSKDMTVSITDNGRGIPVDPHPKFRNKSALEVILTTLHAGGKFSDKVYRTSGGLHGVGVSVVNALSDTLEVEIAREKQLYRQLFRKGLPQGKLTKVGSVNNRRGTTIKFRPDPEIFGQQYSFRPELLYRMASAKAYLFKGVEIRWNCEPSLITPGSEIPETEILHYPNGLSDFINSKLDHRKLIGGHTFCGEVTSKQGERVEWAIAWPDDGDDGFLNTYCNTIPTINGGTHEIGLRTALLKGVRAYAELSGNAKKVGSISADDIITGMCGMLSLFVREPQFQGQIKEKLVSPQVTKLVEQSIKDHFDHWLSGAPEAANDLINNVVQKAEDRLRRKRQKDINRKSATRKMRLPGKLTDCTQGNAKGTEIFLVEGDSAGGSAKQARDRTTQAILPLRGKILNVASATAEKLHGNQELKDLVQALGCNQGDRYDSNRLRYEKVIVMTDADVDGAHIASLLMTFFYREMPKLVESGHLYLAMPPLYRITQSGKTLYARDDSHKDELIETEFIGRAKVEISRFKGLGEMPPAQLKETTMDPKHRTLLKVCVPISSSELQLKAEEAAEQRHLETTIETLMGRKPELRFAFIQKNAKFVDNLDI